MQVQTLSPEEQRDMPVVVSSEYAQKSRRNYTAREENAIAYVSSLIQTPVTENGNYELKYSFSIHDFCKAVGIDWSSGKNIQDVKNTFEGLVKKPFWVPCTKNGKNGETLVIWFSEVTIVNGNIFVELNKNAVPLLYELNRYIKYQLNETLGMKSAYSIRLFQYLLSWKTAGVVEVDVDDLKVLLNCHEQKTYQIYERFKTKIIDKAVKDINENTQITVECKIGSRGARNKVKTLVFVIIPKELQEHINFKNDLALAKKTEAAQSKIDTRQAKKDMIKAQERMNKKKNKEAQQLTFDFDGEMFEEPIQDKDWGLDK